MSSISANVVGFLHTAEVHVVTFDSLLRAADLDVEVVHLVRPDLLEMARRLGPESEKVRTHTASAIRELADHGAAVIMCTCSTIGELAEAHPGPTSVIRADRPMAEFAVRSGHRIAVVAAVASTIEPTLALLHSVARTASVHPTIVSTPCLEAWRFFEDGDHEGYWSAVASHVDRLGPEFDVVVLAQASMLGALPFTNRSGVLASPVSAVEHLRDVVQGKPLAQPG